MDFRGIMNDELVMAALGLPSESRVDRRVPKALLLEKGARTATDKRQITEGIEELLWRAALKPGTIGVPEFRDATREYLEIAVLSLVLRPAAKAPRLVEIIHRAIPYPVLLVTTQAETVSLSLALKRLAQNQAGRLVLDGAPITASLESGPLAAAWLPGLALASQPRTHLLALYEGWIACVEAFQAARITGQPAKTGLPAAQAARRLALADHARLQRELTVLRARAKKEKQLHRRVEANLAIKGLEAQLAQVAESL